MNTDSGERERSSERSDVGRSVSSHRFRCGCTSPTRDVVFNRTEATAQLFNVVRGITTMQHSVTVRAYRNEILDRVKPVRRLKTPERTQVVYVNEAFADFAVASLKVQFAYCTACAVVFDALRSRLRLPLVAGLPARERWCLPDSLHRRLPRPG